MATHEDFDIDYFDTLTIQQFAECSLEDAPQVQDIQEQIRALESDLEELGGLDSLEAALEAAKDDLEAVEVQHELGEATEAEVENARQAVEQARGQLQKAQRKNRALDVLSGRLSAAKEAARRAVRDRAKSLYPDALGRAVEPLEEARSYLEDAAAILNTASKDKATVMQSVDPESLEGVEADLLLFHNPLTLLEQLQDHLTEKGPA